MRRLLTRGLAIAAIVAVLAACSSSGSSGSNLSGKTWQWTASTTASPASQSVTPTPANWTITFGTDGTYTGKASCNQINGSYTTGANGALTIAQPASTRASCGADDDALAVIYIAGLTGASKYSISGSDLTITDANGDTLTFKAS